MKNSVINNLYRFEKLPYESDFFNETYRLIGRSGQTGPIDQLLKYYPNCITGNYVLGADDDGIVYLENYMIFYRVQNRIIGLNDVVFICFNLTNKNGFEISEDPIALFLPKDEPELCFLNQSLSYPALEVDSTFIKNQLNILHSKMDKVETTEINIEEIFLQGDFRCLQFVQLNKLIPADDLLKIESMASMSNN